MSTDQVLHLPNRRFEANKDGPGDYGVPYMKFANVFADLLEPQECGGVVVVQSVARVNPETFGRPFDALDDRPGGVVQPLAGREGKGEVACMQFDGIEAGVRGGIGLSEIRGDERAGDDPRRLERCEVPPPVVDPAGNREPALRRDLLPSFGDDRDLLHALPESDSLHFWRSRHLQVELDRGLSPDQFDVSIDDVTPVFAQVKSEAVGAAADRGRGRRNDVGLAVAAAGAGAASIACLAKGGDVVDVDSKGCHGRIVGRGSGRERMPLSSRVRVLLATLGSAGDTHPFIAVGEELTRRGHRVAMLANPHFEERIRSAGLEHLALGEESDFLDVLHDPRLADQRQSSYLVIDALFNRSVEPSYAAMQDAVKAFRPDVIVRHHIFFAARWVGEQHGIPVVTCSLTPMMWFNKHEPIVFRSHVPTWFQWALARPARFAAKIALRWYIDRPVNRIRTRLGLPPVRDIFFAEARGGARLLGLWSRHFRPPLGDDPPNSRVCGYCFFDRAGGDRDRTLAPRLEEFLTCCESRGREPVVFTLGTTIVHHAQGFFPAALEACRRIGRPALLLIGRGEAGPEITSGQDAMSWEYAPHSLVLPRGAASVHHAGAGSASQALRSGRPSVSVPFVNDEFDIADRMRRLGVSITLPATRYFQQERVVRNLAEGLRQVTADATFLDKARVLGDQIRAEKGAAAAATAVESMGSS